MIRLHHSLEEVQNYEHHSDLLFERWQERWSDRSEGIFERLQLIESQLDDPVEDDAPLRLGIVGTSPAST